MVRENICQKFRPKEIDKTTNYFVEEIKQNELISKKYKMFFKILNYTEHLLILASTATGCISIFSLVSLVSISVGIASSLITIFVKTAGIKTFKLTINKKKKKAC